MRRFHAYGLLVFSLLITGLRLVLLGVTSLPMLVLLIQLLGGLTFPTMWLAGVSYADEHAPEGMRATAQGLFGAVVFGVGMAVGGFLGGPLLQSVGGQGMFFLFGVLVLAITAVATLLSRRLL
jgi:PPP family 3-phenylpropionic acid transporter